ncbi:MAG: Ig-like domain-containing protein [Deltaproteobacteria bacterium]|nr:Ig-like domain-containing protein [Deltaproteobacteria bacterium]
MRKMRVFLCFAFIVLLSFALSCSGGGGTEQDLPGPSTTVPMSVFLTTNRVFVDVAGGPNSANLAARVMDGSGRPVINAAVRFITDLGRFNNSAQTYTTTTGSTGLAFASLLSDSVGQARAIVQIPDSRLADSVDVFFTLESVQAPGIDLMADPPYFSREQAVTITARLSDENNNPIPFHPISFSVPDTNAHDYSEITDSHGEASFTFPPMTASLFSASARFPFGTITEYISAPSANIINVEFGDMRTNPETNEISLPVIVAVFDNNGTPVPGIAVRLSPSAGNIVRYVVTEESGAFTGEASATWHLGTYSGEAALTAFIGAISTTETTTISLIFPIDIISLALGNTQIDEDTGEISYPVMAAVLDENGDPVQGITVRFSATAGDIIGFATTDEDGLATATWYLGNYTGQATLTAFIGDVSDSATVNIVQDLLINPAEATLREIGRFISFEIFGGMPPYTIDLSDETFVEWNFSMVSGHGVLQVQTASMPPEAVDITIFVVDSVGTTATAILTLDPTAAPALLLTPAATSFSFAGESVTFTALGGVAPYTFTLSHPQFLSGVQSGNTFAVTVTNLPVTIIDDAALEVIDAGGSRAFSQITLNPSPGNPGTGNLTITAAGGVTQVASGDVVQFFATGGTPPYTWTANGGLWDTDGDLAGDSATTNSVSAQPVVFVVGNNTGIYFISVTDTAGNGSNYRIEIQQE